MKPKKKLNKAQFRDSLIDLFDEFIVAVHNANLARVAQTPLEPEITYTFDNFMKWILYERNKKVQADELKKKIKNNKKTP